MLKYIKKNCIYIFLVIFVLFLLYNRYYILETFCGDSTCLEGMRKNLRFGRVKSHRSKVQEGATEYVPGPDYKKMTGGSTEYVDESGKYFNPL